MQLTGEGVRWKPELSCNILAQPLHNTYIILAILYSSHATSTMVNALISEFSLLNFCCFSPTLIKTKTVNCLLIVRRLSFFVCLL
jgi:hypothetical protein